MVRVLSSGALERGRQGDRGGSRRRRGEAFSEHRQLHSKHKLSLGDFDFGPKLGEGAYAVVR